MPRWKDTSRSLNRQKTENARELTDGNGLVYLRARYLAPGLGTFVSRDPWRGTASAPRTWNGYAWVEGNVVNRVDPGGMQAGIAAC